MDPTATLTRLLQLLECNDTPETRDAIIDCLDNLKEWLEHQGFFPDLQKALEYKLGSSIY